MTLREATVEKLKVLPDEQIEVVAHFIENLKPPTKGRYDDLEGSVNPEEVEKMERAIKEAFERVDEY